VKRPRPARGRRRIAELHRTELDERAHHRAR
jgi:hypothetical protein